MFSEEFHGSEVDRFDVIAKSNFFFIRVKNLRYLPRTRRFLKADLFCFGGGWPVLTEMRLTDHRWFCLISSSKQNIQNCFRFFITSDLLQFKGNN